MTDEIWKSVVGNDQYEVSSFGRVRSKDSLVSVTNKGRQYWRKKTGKILQLEKSALGYFRCGLVFDGVGQIKKSVHRIVAQAFIPNPEGKPQVNHKNGVRDDNAVSNLEWATCSENVAHGFRSNGRIHPQRGVTGPMNKNSRKIIGTHTETGATVEFDSAKCAQRAGKFVACCISNCLAGRAKTHGGFTWKHADPRPEEIQ